MTGTGESNLHSVTTKPDRTFAAAGVAPNTVANGWTVQAHYGDEETESAGNKKQVVGIVTVTDLAMFLSPTRRPGLALSILRAI